MTEASVNANVKPEEKPSEQNKRVRLYTLGLLSLLVLALIVSMWSAPSPKPKETKLSTADSAPAPNFSEQVQFEQNRLNADRLKHQSAEENTVDMDEEGWQKKERLRVLNSRMTGFGIDDAEKNPKSGTANDYTSRFPVVYQAGAATTQPMQVQQLIQVSDAANQGDPGACIVGKAVDGRYPCAQQGDMLLVPTGFVIDGVLDQDLKSDYSGPWMGHLTNDVYSVDNQFILFPKGTKIMGQSLPIGNVNAPIQNRMGLTVEWAVLPNGKRIDFRKNTPVDQAGIAAFEGDVNHHFVAQFLSVAAYALISGVGPRDQMNEFGVVNPTFKGQFADGYRAALLPFVMKYLCLVPTVTLAAGMPIKVITQDDLYIKPWARVNTTIY